MKLEATVPTLEGIPEELHENYAAVDVGDGTKVFRLIHLAGHIREEDVAGLKSALQKERSNVKDVSTRLGAEAELLRAQLAAMDADLATAAARQAATTAIQAAAGDIEVVLPLVEKRLRATKASDGSYEVTVLGEGGKAPLLKDDGTPQSIADLVATLRETKPALFRGTGSSGGGSFDAELPDRGMPLVGQRNQRRTKMTAAEKVGYIRAHGKDKYEALPW